MKSLFANMPASTTTCISPKSSCWEMNKISSETTLSRNVKVTITEIRATRTHERVFTCWTRRRWRLIGQYCDAGCRVSLPFFLDYLTYFNVTFSKNLRVLFGPKVIYMCNFFFSLRHYPSQPPDGTVMGAGGIESLACCLTLRCAKTTCHCLTSRIDGGRFILRPPASVCLTGESFQFSPVWPRSNWSFRIICTKGWLLAVVRFLFSFFLGWGWTVLEGKWFVW